MYITYFFEKSVGIDMDIYLSLFKKANLFNNNKNLSFLILFDKIIIIFFDFCL